MEKYAILIIGTLKLKKFEFKDDYKIAVNSLLQQGKDFVTFKYNHSIEAYVMPEQVKI